MKIEEVSNRCQFGSMLNTYGCKIGAEIGVNTGKFSRILLDTSNLEILFSIDVWLTDAEQAGRMTKNRTGDLNIASTMRALEVFGNRSCMIRWDSRIAYKLFPDGYFDFIHIDGAHKYEYCNADIRNYWPKMKEGGIFTGHDYCERHPNDVYRAVNEFVSEKELKAYFTLKERHPSFIIQKC